MHFERSSFESGKGQRHLEFRGFRAREHEAFLQQLLRRWPWALLLEQPDGQCSLSNFCLGHAGAAEVCAPGLALGMLGLDTWSGDSGSYRYTRWVRWGVLSTRRN